MSRLYCPIAWLCTHGLAAGALGGAGTYRSAAQVVHTLQEDPTRLEQLNQSLRLLQSQGGAASLYDRVAAACCVIAATLGLELVV